MAGCVIVYKKYFTSKGSRKGLRTPGAGNAKEV